MLRWEGFDREIGGGDRNDGLFDTSRRMRK